MTERIGDILQADLDGLQRRVEETERELEATLRCLDRERQQRKEVEIVNDGLRLATVNLGQELDDTRAQLEAARELKRAAWEERDSMQTQVQRLRRALEEHLHLEGFTSTPTACDCGIFEEEGTCRHSRARAALAPAPADVCSEVPSQPMTREEARLARERIAPSPRCEEDDAPAETKRIDLKLWTEPGWDRLREAAERLDKDAPAEPEEGT